MKKLFISMLCIGMVLIGVVGCSDKKTNEEDVQEVVTKFMDTVKTGDMDKIDNLGIDGATLSFDDLEGAHYAKEFLSEVLKTVDYKIKSTEIKKDKQAIVVVDITNHQIGELLANKELITEIIAEAVKDADANTSSEKYMEFYFNKLKEKYKTEKPEKKTTEVTLTLNKNSKDVWTIENNSELGNAFLGDLISFYDQLNKTLEDTKTE